MSTKRSSAREKLIAAALDLFATQGVTETTTRQIAEYAGVNEVTLFRQFGSKHGLMLAAIEETAVFSVVAQGLLQHASEVSGLEQALMDYADGRLEALEAMPEFVRSLVGESGQYPPEHRQAIGRELTQANHFVAQYLELAIARGQLQTVLSADKIASLLNSLLLGYAVLEFTSDFHQLWRDRQDFLENLVGLFLRGAVQHQDGPEGTLRLAAADTIDEAHPDAAIDDLPAPVVHDLLRRAKALGEQDYALMYILFGSGLSPQEIATLERVHYSCDRTQQLLQVPGAEETLGHCRRVPVNQWILGRRYGNYSKNPLTQWLKTRRDDAVALFVSEIGEPLNAQGIEQCWQRCLPGLNSELPIVRAQQTWRVEMLTRGMSLENLSLLTGLSVAELAPYAQRAKVKRALDEALRLDRRKPGEVSSAVGDVEHL